MKVYVLGTGTLAEAIRCNLHDAYVPEPGERTGHGDIIWMAYDTPLEKGDVAGVQQVKEWFDRDYTALGRPYTNLVIVSSQLPVGSCKWFEENYQNNTFAVVPENVRAGLAVQDWRHQARIVVGVRDRKHEVVLNRLLGAWTNEVVWMTPESAEMVKHAINGFLALCITYVNEIADVCEHVGADPEQMAYGLLTEGRIGRRLPLHPGEPYGGGHLQREINNLIWFGGGPVIRAIKDSNQERIDRS